MHYEEVMLRLKSLARPEAVSGMARYGINPHNTYGISIPDLRKLARETGKDHLLALRLWASGIHEARILASMVDEPARVTEAQMESWARDFDSWDVCDQVCGNLFDKTPFALTKAVQWSQSHELFVKRAGFAIVAWLAFHDKKAPDAVLLPFLSLIKEQANDERPYVRKAVNWALRQIGKRNAEMNRKAVEAATQLLLSDSKPARWVASDALRELTSQAVQDRLAR